MLKRMVLMLLGVVLVFGGIFGYKLVERHFMGEYFANFTPPPRVVSADYAREEIWQPSLSAIGTLRAVNGVDLSGEVEGKVKAIHFQSGQFVKQGALLLEIDDEVEQANLKSFQARLKLAQLNFQRDEKLIQKRLTSQEQSDRSRAELDEVYALVEQTKATIAKKKIRAPFAGKVGIRKVNLGQYLSKGDPLTTLQAMDAFYLDFSLPEQDYTQIYLNQELTFSVDAYPGEAFKARVTAVNAKVDVSTRSILVRAQFDNSQGLLLPGMFTAVKLMLKQNNTVVTLPQTAVTFSLYGESVFKVEQNGKNEKGEPQLVAQRVSVVSGDVRGDRVAIKSGVAVGDLIVIDGQIKLKNGTAIALANSEVLESNRAELKPSNGDASYEVH
ncbi:MAG: efflux RND transporter periplasmic adaptor subunit [Pseudomonadales bacterium]|nr:efflux RND transporter periplasmic adaptor subunit [Pseudomonadales bacterium]